MALIHLDFESQYMGCNQDVYIIMPDKPRDMKINDFYDKNRKYKVLWLLHGTFGGYSDWIRKSNIELYACEKDLIVVMPSVGNSSYEAWDNFTLGYDSEKYIVDELMPLVYNWLPASDKREDNFIAGLSMGGAGALKFALKYPEKFEAVASLSSCPRKENRRELEKLFKMSRKQLKEDPEFYKANLRRYNRLKKFDSVDEYLNSSANLYKLLMDNLDNPDLPRIMFACGTEDPLVYKSFKALKKELTQKGFKASWFTGKGSHEWRVWDRDIQIAFDFFGLNEKEKGNKF